MIEFDSLIECGGAFSSMPLIGFDQSFPESPAKKQLRPSPPTNRYSEGSALRSLTMHIRTACPPQLSGKESPLGLRPRRQQHDHLNNNFAPPLSQEEWLTPFWPLVNAPNETFSCEQVTLDSFDLVAYGESRLVECCSSTSSQNPTSQFTHAHAEDVCFDSSLGEFDALLDEILSGSVTEPHQPVETQSNCLRQTAILLHPVPCQQLVHRSRVFFHLSNDAVSLSGLGILAEDAAPRVITGEPGGFDDRPNDTFSALRAARWRLRIYTAF
ncbi:hypothetical protein K491DRAFT_255712 [Lophiostoma macrostomum CBS 122681]|uniref:Uncharacterized protein n=1 Tax=Lophiostoma macrostomum CBS 122681 TaxID=1314788 RepID=A0A6A6SJZ6_9PLEO|nr:hypothetical protein K491DRAFT_255712 [Lophiostoma macrostomum CBS 122681]